MASSSSSSSNISLVDEEGAITDQLEAVLKHIFSKYCIPCPTQVAGQLLEPPVGAVISSEGLDKWAEDTNGAPFSQETKEELIEFLDVTDNGDLTLKGFIQIYELQTDNDEEETWRDLSKHGFDRNLQLKSPVSSNNQ